MAKQYQDVIEHYQDVSEQYQDVPEKYEYEAKRCQDEPTLVTKRYSIRAIVQSWMVNHASINLF